MLRLAGKNAARLDVPPHVKIHHVVNVMLMTPYSNQPSEISAPILQRPDPVPAVQGTEYVVHKILKHCRRGDGYKFLTLVEGDPIHYADWQPMRDFVGKDGRMNEEFAR